MNFEATKKDILYSVLCDIGLSTQEIDLYMYSLSVGPVSIVHVAEGIGVSRPNVYKLIASLERNGLTDFSTRTKKYGRLFSVVPPSRILELLRERNIERKAMEHAFVKQLPHLQQAYTQGEQAPRVGIYRGREEYRKVFRMVTEESDAPVLFCGSITDFISTAGSDFRALIRERTKKQLSVHALFLPGPDATALKKRGAEELREVRVLINTVQFRSSFQLFAHKVLFWQPVAPAAVVIEDQLITDMMRALFQTLWDQAQEIL